jgi:pimeloyl-ACP methyl ester carboxylesterase
MIERDINITRWGTVGPTVILIHGSVQGAKAGGDTHFQAQAVLAEQGWQLVVPDRPGHGCSPSAHRPDDFELDAQWVAELLGDGAHLVGHSYGGLVALAAAARRPAAVLSLTLIEAAMQALTMDDPRTQNFARQMGEAISGAASLADLAVRFSTVTGVPPELKAHRDEAELEQMGRSLTVIRLPTPERIQEMLGVVSREAIPLLLVTGGWCPGIDASSERAAELAQGRLVVVKTPHHFPQLNVHEFNRTLAGFMTTSQDGARR